MVDPGVTTKGVSCGTRGSNMIPCARTGKQINDVFKTAPYIHPSTLRVLSTHGLDKTVSDIRPSRLPQRVCYRIILITVYGVYVYTRVVLPPRRKQKKQPKSLRWRGGHKTARLKDYSPGHVGGHSCSGYCSTRRTLWLWVAIPRSFVTYK